MLFTDDRARIFFTVEGAKTQRFFGFLSVFGDLSDKKAARYCQEVRVPRCAWSSGHRLKRNLQAGGAGNEVVQLFKPNDSSQFVVH